jgi:hypothetical protein
VSALRSAWRWLGDEPHQRHGLRSLQVALGAMLLFRCFTEAPFAGHLWGPHGLGEGSTAYALGPALGGLLDRAFGTEAGTVMVVVALAAGALGLMLGFRTRLATGLALLALFLLESRLPEMGDGGDNVARIVLLYMLFALPAQARAERPSLAVWLHNVAMLAVALQVVVLYSTAGFSKTFGDRWQHGTATYYLSQVEWFSLPALRYLFKHPLVATLTSYGPPLYMVWFPIAILSRLKLWWIAVGILFHLGIAVGLGLVTFSTVMIGLLLFLVSDGEYEWLRGRAGSAWAKAKFGFATTVGIAEARLASLTTKRSAERPSD